MPAFQLDHVVIDARDRLDAAAETYRRLGFHLTERGHHTLGSINHLAIFGTDYMELLGTGTTGPRADIANYPVGLNGLVYKLPDPDATYAALSSAGFSVDPPIAFSRPVALPDGTRDAAFVVVRLTTGSVPFGRFYFCHHASPDMVWRPEWQSHPNGVIAIRRMVIAVHDPAASTAMVERAAPGGGAAVEFVTRSELDERFGTAAADPSGRDEFMAALVFQVSDLALATAVVGKARNGRVIVPASAAINTTLVFEE